MTAKALWEDEDSQPRSTYQAHKGCSMNVREEENDDNGRITTNSLTLVLGKPRAHVPSSFLVQSLGGELIFVPRG